MKLHSLRYVLLDILVFLVLIVVSVVRWPFIAVQICQWLLVEYHLVICGGLIIYIDALTPQRSTKTAGTGPTIASWALAPTRIRSRSGRRRTIRSLCSCLPEGVPIVRDIQHLLPPAHAKLAHAAVARDVPPVPMLERPLL